MSEFKFNIGDKLQHVASPNVDGKPILFVVSQARNEEGNTYHCRCIHDDGLTLAWFSEMEVESYVDPLAGLSATIEAGCGVWKILWPAKRQPAPINASPVEHNHIAMVREAINDATVLKNGCLECQDFEPAAAIRDHLDVFLKAIEREEKALREKITGVAEPKKESSLKVESVGSH